jgi:c-di-GMP-binding flagellar brake protein YcgR
MPTKAVPKKKKAPRKAARIITVPVDINRRREWRFDLPLKTRVEGTLPQGKKFKEDSKIENISSGGAFFCLDSGVVIGSKLHLVIDVPSKITRGKKVQLRVGGITVRLEKPDRKGKKQGVAVRFDKDFEFFPGRKA